MFRWGESLQRTNVSSGKLYAIPWDGGNILWFYNKDAFDRYGVPYPIAHDWKVVRLSTDFQGEQNLFETGKYAMMITGPWSFPGLRRYEGETGWQNWDIAPMWSYKGKRQTRQTPDAVANWSQTKYPEEGWDLIKFIAADGAHSGATRRGWLRWRREGA